MDTGAALISGETFQGRSLDIWKCSVFPEQCETLDVTDA